jgi:cyclophilin family peptidyl-prolyl cis-trans isomerase
MTLIAGCGGGNGGGQPGVSGGEVSPPFIPLEVVIPGDTDEGADQRPQVTLTVTNGAGIDGEVVITLLPEYAPLTVENFLTYVNNGFYNGTIFHRYEQGFVFQGGGYSAPVAATDTPVHKETRAPIGLEIKVSNVRGTVAMARATDLNSATSEFFINLADNTFLNTNSGGYTAFGYISDMTVVSGMEQAPCVTSVVTTGTNSCLPVPNLVITSAVQTRP